MVGGVLGVALALSSCTSAEQDTATSTSITLDAPEAVEQNDSTLRYGLSTSPTESWAHYRTGCDTSCGVVLGAITDTLFATSGDGETVGLLVERTSSNNDNTVHTWRLRDGIVFSDGTEFDGAAAKLNIDACRHSALTGPGLAGIDDVRADGQTLTITTLAPWGSLAVHFAETPCGHMFSGAWLRSLPDLPMRIEDAPFFDPVISEISPVGNARQPVGLGAFVMTSFTPGNGNSTVLERNETYWRGAEGVTGEGLPYADELELVVIGDDATRRSGFGAGQFDIVHSREPAEIERIAELGTSVRSDAFGDVVHLAFNAVDTEANPLRWVSCRRAIDRSIDIVAVREAFGQRSSNGPIDWPATMGAGPSENGDPISYPHTFDPAPGSQWAERCVEDHGSGAALRLLAVSGDSRAGEVASMIERTANRGTGDFPRLSVDVVEMASNELAVAVLLGDFDIVLWEGFSGTHPDLHFSWWFSEASAPIGSIATNVSRIDDPTLDRALVDVRRADDAERSFQRIGDAAAAFRVGSWSSWLTRVEWVIGFDDGLDGDLVRTTPEGIELVPVINGVHSLHSISGS